MRAVQRHPGYVHGDFTGDNLFVLPDGSYRVIDWQRPFFGPTELDIASMIEALGFNPANHVSTGIVQMRSFMLIHWVTSCSMRWFPDATQTYDRLTAEQVAKIESLSVDG
jgi:aminoglycoside phosphotransferase (APT) family kinase protein